MAEVKPIGYKTLIQWMQENKTVKDESLIESFITTDRNGKAIYRGDMPCIYQYVSPENVRDATRAEQAAFWEKHRRPSGMRVKAPGKEKVDIAPPQPISSDANVIVFDTETTGCSINYDEVLQISVCDKFAKPIVNQYIKPVNHKSWYGAERVNHISPDMVAFSPTAKTYAPGLSEKFRDADIVVGHNVSFDSNMIAQCFGIKIPKEKLCDTLSQFKKDKKDGPHKLEDAVKFYCPDFIDSFLQGAHDSSMDTKATAMVFSAQQTRIKEKYDSYMKTHPDAVKTPVYEQEELDFS